MKMTFIILLVMTLLPICHTWRTSTKWPSESVIQNELTSQLEGDVIMPSDEDYYRWILSRNLDFVRRPGAIAMVANSGKLIFITPYFHVKYRYIHVFVRTDSCNIRCV